MREQLSNIPINTHKLNSRWNDCFIYLLIHQCWSNLGWRCSLWQRYPPPGTGSPKWWWVYPFRWQKQQRCGANMLVAVRMRPRVSRDTGWLLSVCYQSNLAPLSGFGGAFLQQRSSFASRKREPPATERLRWEAQIRHISDARCLK